MKTTSTTGLFLDPNLARYGFGPTHPFNNDRYAAFADLFQKHQLETKVTLLQGRSATDIEITRFHTPEYLRFVKEQSAKGVGFLDEGDTPVVPGIFEAAAYVVGTVLEAVYQIMQERIKYAFVPIAGLHHSHPAAASGFCVFNDCAIAINTLRKCYNIKNIAYVDIDVHHGDGVYYAFEDDENLIFADVHQSNLFPGTGFEYEQGTTQAKGKKVNIPLPAGAGDEEFFTVWPQVEALLEREKPEFILLQCGADSLAHDPLGFLRYSDKPHAYAAQQLCKIADQYASGRLLALGGGGYNLHNIARAWIAVTKSLIKSSFG